jgi:TonB family protein
MRDQRLHILELSPIAMLSPGVARQRSRAHQGFGAVLFSRRGHMRGFGILAALFFVGSYAASVDARDALKDSVFTEDEYKYSVYGHLALQQRRYPPAAKQQQLEGTVWLSFRVDASGAVRNISVVQSSGHDVLDQEGIAMVRRASPYP